MSAKTIIICALTGGAAVPRRHPNFPITPEQIATQGLEAADAGAAILHIHVRNPSTGAPSSDIAHYREVVDRIRERNDEVIVNLTTGYGGIFVPTPGDWTRAAPGTNVRSAAERVAHVVELKPDICSLDMNTMQMADVMSGDRSSIMVVMNLDPIVAEMATAIRAAGVLPEVEIFESGDLARAQRMIADGLLKGPGLYTLVLAPAYGLPPTQAAVSFALGALPSGCIWTAMGTGSHSFRMAAQSYLMGGHVRVGLEDNLYLSKGVMASSNAALVKHVRQMIELMGGEIASVTEARAILGLAR
jgi:uncharacterized protein (DUF849 family)